MLTEFFQYNNNYNRLEIAKSEIFLVKEFGDLLDYDRNKCKEDPTGKQCLRAYRELTYIWLALSWQSPFKDFLEQDRHLESLRQSGLTEEEFNDPTFRAACRKFKQIQDENRSIKMLKAAQMTVDKFIDYFQNIDVEERDSLTGKPIWKVETIMKEISNIHKVHEELKILEDMVKKEISETSNIRGGAEDGFEFQG